MKKFQKIYESFQLNEINTSEFDKARDELLSDISSLNNLVEKVKLYDDDDDIDVDKVVEMVEKLSETVNKALDSYKDDAVKLKLLK